MSIPFHGRVFTFSQPDGSARGAPIDELVRSRSLIAGRLAGRGIHTDSRKR